ncbi:hypothetical protein [Qipengyuania sp. JC766]|uniref:hypothetical protein n=1 Tax=Qipengyuania sp. JC766 TaxID=3232139 RepID=UPI0034583880
MAFSDGPDVGAAVQAYAVHALAIGVAILVGLYSGTMWVAFPASLALGICLVWGGVTKDQTIYSIRWYRRFYRNALFSVPPEIAGVSQMVLAGIILWSVLSTHIGPGDFLGDAMFSSIGGAIFAYGWVHWHFREEIKL